MEHQNMGNPQHARKIIYVKKRSHLKLKYESSTHMQNNMMYSTFMGEFSITMFSLYLNKTKLEIDFIQQN
jgi:hypothetical protein